ncbi:hypothetical protein F4813DRAFT_390256 [Daldinia decipiens]|uniref:uncharacterized protein n=1 Tax=Daldinia decipiens TaxID=326647 RepID=UPI0020C5465A|nr:uncharacterized protein F4813DRAFT_390256 [Daldinia decipiens]KAI1656915.1 hypothetical protein F4813DRAFT_390256 [Daldinia decipiens]
MTRLDRIHRHLARTKDMREPDELTWREDRLIPILDTSNIHNRRQLNDLLKRYVPTMKAVKKLPANTAFVALEVKPKFVIGGLFDVDLALLTKLEEHTCSKHEEMLSLADFITERQVKVMSLRINMIGREEVVKPRATTTIVNAMRQLCKEVLGQNIALIGFSLPKDIERIGLNFADINNMFPYWIDLSRMIAAVSPTLAYHQIKMGTILYTFGYNSIGTIWFVGTPIVVNEAVKALAVLEGLQCREGVNKLILGERKFPGIEIEAQVEAFRFMPYKALIHNQGSRLPPSIDSAQKLAFVTEDYRPIGVAADICDVRFEGFKPCCPGIRETHMTRGCVCFKDKKALDEFINDVDGSVIDGVTIKVENIPYQTFWKYLKDAIKAKGTYIYDRLEIAAMMAKGNIPRWYDALFSPADNRFPWCPNPEDAPPGYYDTDDDSITYTSRLRG